MEKTIQPTEARTLTDLVVEETTFSPAIEAVMKKSFPSSTQEARLSLGEDSCTTFAFEGTYTVGTETQVLSTTGTIEVGASYERSQTGKVPQVAKDLVFYSLLGALRPAAQAAVLNAVEGRIDDSITNDEAAQVIIDAFNLAPASLAAGKKAIADRRMASVRTVSAPVKINLA